MADVIVVAILAVVVIAAARYIYKAKKNGAKCIGCSAATCHCHASEEKSGPCSCAGKCPESHH